MNSLGNNVPPIAAAVQISMDINGQLNVQATGEPLAIFSAMGAAMNMLAIKFQEQKNNSIQIAPEGLINRLPKG